jgi:hypothetical protein
MKAAHSFDNPKTNLTYEKKPLYLLKQISCQILYKYNTASSNKKMFLCK